MFSAVGSPGPLVPFVDAVWVARAEEEVAARELVLPTGDVDLIVQAGRDPVVVGPSNRSRVIASAGRARVLGVTFKVGGAAALLGVPLHELRDQIVPLGDRWGPQGGELQDRAVTAVDGNSALSAAMRVLLARVDCVTHWPHPVTMDAAARLSSADTSAGMIGAVAEAHGMTIRRLEQVFRGEVGLPPKTFQRLQRFRRAVASIDVGADVGWARFAVELGYLDQAHFVNEFRAHCGLTPTNYLKARGSTANHVPLTG